MTAMFVFPVIMNKICQSDLEDQNQEIHEQEFE